MLSPLLNWLLVSSRYAAKTRSAFRGRRGERPSFAHHCLDHRSTFLRRSNQNVLSCFQLPTIRSQFMNASCFMTERIEGISAGLRKNRNLLMRPLQAALNARSPNQFLSAKLSDGRSPSLGAVGVQHISSTRRWGPSTGCAPSSATVPDACPRRSSPTPRSLAGPTKASRSPPSSPLSSPVLADLPISVH